MDGEGGAEPEGDAKILEAYFSATGTTKALAEYTANAMGADLYEITPQEPYTDEQVFGILTVDKFSVQGIKKP